jgi:hypothetical protein
VVVVAVVYKGEKNRKCEPLKKTGGHYRKGYGDAYEFKTFVCYSSLAI